MTLGFGEKIKILREENNLSQTELGKKLHITQRKVSYIECGKYSPSIEDVRAFCLFFKVSADYLLDLEEGMRYPER